MRVSSLLHSGFFLAGIGTSCTAFIRASSGRLTIRRRHDFELPMISNLFNQQGSKKPAEEALPRDVKDAVKQCREATQSALQDRVSRMRVEFPVGTQFGVEPRPKKKNKEPTLLDLQMSDRELARVYVEMFQPVGGQNIAVAFRTEDEAEAAKKAWKGDPSAQCSIKCLNRNKKSAKQKAKGRGFAAKMAAEFEKNDDSGPFKLQDNTEVLLFVAPSLKEKLVIDRVCEDAGMGTLVVLLNARDDTLRSKDDFQDIFHLGAGPQQVAPSCLMFYRYGKEWVLARKPKIGPPQSILVQTSKPGEQECQAAFDSLELSAVERSMENVLENASSWFK